MPKNERSRFATICGMITFVVGVAICLGSFAVMTIPGLNIAQKCLLPISGVFGMATGGVVLRRSKWAGWVYGAWATSTLIVAIHLSTTEAEGVIDAGIGLLEVGSMVLLVMLSILALLVFFLDSRGAV